MSGRCNLAAVTEVPNIVNPLTQKARYDRPEVELPGLVVCNKLKCHSITDQNRLASVLEVYRDAIADY